MRDELFNFEKLDVYKKSLDFVDFVYDVTTQFPREERFVLVDQFRRAAVSISLNIAEGADSSSLQFKRYLRISKGSIRECIAIITLCKMRNYINTEKEQDFIDTFYKKGPTYRLPRSIDFFNPPNIDKFYLDSLQVFSKCYNDVFAKRAPNGGLYPYSQSLQNPEIRPTTFYYTVNEGIIRIDFNDSSYWGLTEIISP